jgi:anti-sigma regulatory factor (Ser/Thr protein kinase)
MTLPPATTAKASDTRSAKARRARAPSRTELAVPNRIEEVERVSDLLDEFGAKHGLAKDDLTDMQVALDEAFANIVNSAYSDGDPHEIHICLAVGRGTLRAVIEDDGMPFDPLAVAAPDLSLPLHERPVGGLGIHFIKSLMSDVKYKRIGDRNRLTLTKLLSE